MWRALTTPSLVNQWCAREASVVEPRVGGRYELGWPSIVDGRDVRGGPTHILEYEERVRLVLTWPDWRGDASVSAQTISVARKPTGAGTDLTLVHAGFGRTCDVATTRSAGSTTSRSSRRSRGTPPALPDPVSPA